MSVETIEQVTEFPEMMDGRVKTLHPKVFGGILARRDNAKDMEEAARFNIPLFDLIVVNLYPFWEHLGETPAEQSVFIDIGGPSMIRAAAKNSAAVTVLSLPSDYAEFVAEMDSTQGQTSLAFRQKMAGRAFRRTSEYDRMIANEWDEKRDPSISRSLQIDLEPKKPLRYGENPHQAASWAGTASWECLQGKELSFNNLLDCDAALRIVRDVKEPCVAIVKHNNPCGAASGAKQTVAQLFDRALSCDSKSAFGGIVAVNAKVDDVAAELMSKIFLEVIVAEAFTEKAKEILSQKKNLRLIEWAKPLFQDIDVRAAMGGWLVQSRDKLTIPTKLETVSRNQVSDSLWPDLKFAWLICKHVKSNAIVVVKDGMTLGIGAGQMSRVDSVGFALEKSKAFDRKGAVLASDAFFPFRDNIDLLKGTGIQAVIEPGGSQRDAEVIAACDELGIALVFTGERHFRH